MALSSQPPRTPAVGVTTVSNGSGDLLEGFLETVPVSRADFSVVVVAVSGAMNSPIRSLPPDVKWEPFSNPHAVRTAGATDPLVAAGNTDPRTIAIGPVVMTDGEVYPSAVVVHRGAHPASDPSARMIAGHRSARRFLIGKYSGWCLWPLRAALVACRDLRSASLSRRAAHH